MGENDPAHSRPHFGQGLRIFRKDALGLTQQQFAEVLGVDSKQPSRWENLSVPPKGWRVFYQLIVKRWPNHATLVPNPDHWERKPRKSASLAVANPTVPVVDRFWPQALKLDWDPLQTLRQAASWVGVGEGDIWADPYQFARIAAAWMKGEGDIHKRCQLYRASVEAEYYGRCQALLFLGRCVDLQMLRAPIRSAFEASTGQFRFQTFAELTHTLADLFPLNVSEELACCFICKEVAHVVVAEFGELVANDAIVQNDSLRANEIWLFAKSQKRVRKLRRRLSAQLSRPGIDHHEALARSLTVLSEIPQGWRSMSVAGIAALPSLLESRQVRPSIFSR